jgi:hypothetical protein
MLSRQAIAGRLRKAYVPWVIAACGAVVAAAVLRATGPSGFERFLGPLPPVLTVAAAGAVGFGTLRFLEERGYWATKRATRMGRSLALATVIAFPFAAAAILVDVAVGFPEDINIAWPRSLLFYPAIALVAETAFHLVPLAAAMWLGRVRLEDGGSAGRPGPSWAWWHW